MHVCAVVLFSVVSSNPMVLPPCPNISVTLNCVFFLFFFESDCFMSVFY